MCVCERERARDLTIWKKRLNGIQKNRRNLLDWPDLLKVRDESVKTFTLTQEEDF